MKSVLKWIGLSLLALVLVLTVYLAMILPQDEMTNEQMTEEMVRLLQGKMEKDHKRGGMKRDAHPKCLGLARAVFTVDSTLAPELQVGVFQPGRSYPALLRFSNASGRIQSDKKKDFRGLGIKLIGVEGPRFDSTETNSQDFVMMSNPTMPLGTVRLFYNAVYYSIKHNKLALLAKMLVGGHMDVLKQLASGAKHDTSPLDITYWSTTPYALGDMAVKYRLVPTSEFQSQLPDTLTDNYLSENMARYLREHPATFDFYIQPFTNQDETPLEDAAVEWQSPYIKVATLTLPIQNVDSPLRRETAEQLFYSPGNALESERPLGGLNTARVKIYRTLTKFRHNANGDSLLPPSQALYDSLK